MGVDDGEVLDASTLRWFPDAAGGFPLVRSRGSESLRGRTFWNMFGTDGTIANCDLDVELEQAVDCKEEGLMTGEGVVFVVDVSIAR